MTCPACNHQNLPNAKFCVECGAGLKAGCSNCGAELTPNAKFCHECGTSVTGAVSARPAEPDGARKIVSILFADLAGSTALHERLDAESARRFMESYYAVARKAVESHGGKVTQFLGDGVLAMFGIPQVAEDDAIRAVRAGVAMQEAFQALADQQREAIGETGLRVAVNTGEVVVKGETDIIGDPVNVAARLQDHGSNGDVVIGEATEHLVADKITLELLGAFDLKGRSGNVKAYKVLSLEPPQRAVAPFVGRVKELARIQAVYDAATSTSNTQMAVLLGSAGLGKSRLIGEFARRSSAAATIIQAHCDAARGATFAPIADALRKHLQLDADASTEEVRAAVEAVAGENDHARITKGIVGLLTGQPSSPEETFFVIRRFLGGLTNEQPVVLIIDDLQWAEPLLFDLVEHLVQWGHDLPLFLLIGARPELREVRSAFGKADGFVDDVLTLEGLDATAAMQLAAGVIGAGELPSTVAAKVLATSEGNPLFISELIRMLVVEGALIHENDEWRAGDNIASVEMPPTIHALLASRIERLDPLDCAILERAAVIGRQFSRNAVTALLPNNPAEIDKRLEALQRYELIERGSGWFIGEPVLRFHHVLIRDAAYRRLLKGSRAELHAKLADWVEAQVGDAQEHDETIGRHLEDAHRLLGELGPLDEAGEKLGDRAATRLASAGRRALEADDVPLAAGLLGRAIERLRPDDPDRADLCIDWCEALLAEGEVTTAQQAIEELSRLMHDSERLQAWHDCFVGQHTVLTAPRELTATVTSVSAAAQKLAGLEDSAGEAKAHYVHALALSRQGQIGACEAALDQALAAARKAEDRRQANTVLAIAPIAALWGPSPVTRASGRCLDVVRVLRITQGAPAVEAVALMCQGVLEALRGRSEAAHRMIESGREMVEELGIAPQLRNADAFTGYVHLLEGDLTTAETKLRSAYEGLRDLGLGIDAARAAALLAKTLLAKGEIEEAKTLSHESEQLAGDDLKAAIAWRGVRAEALAGAGEHDDAIKLAQKAVRIAEKTDALLDHADARQALAVALRAAGQAQEANAEEQRARKLWEDKGATLLLDARQASKDSPAVSDTPQQRSPDTSPVSLTISPGVQQDSRLARLGKATTDAIARQDFAQFRSKFHDDYQELDHSTGVTYGVDGTVASVRNLFKAENPFHKTEVLAALGSNLTLLKRQWGASGSTSKVMDVGAFEGSAYVVMQATDDNLWIHGEAFAPNKLGDAIVRLYERYAESLPEGPERNSQLTISKFFTTANGPFNIEGWAAGLASDIQAIDHRTVGFGTLTGAEAAVNAVNVLVNELSKDVIYSYADVAALTPDATLFLSASTGTDRSSGGKWERTVWELIFYDDTGLAKHWERFEENKGNEAFARFHELTGGEPTSVAPKEVSRFTYRLRPGVHPNHMTASNANWVAALAAGNPEREQNALHEDIHELDHATGSDWGREGIVDSAWRLIRSREPFYQVEALATLGPTLALSTRCYGASGGRSRKYDVGAYEIVRHEVMEGGEDGIRRMESFAEDRLTDAISRLYERYAESLPDGPERKTPLNISAYSKFVQGMDLDAIRPLMTTDFRYVDNRHAGLGTVDTADAFIHAVSVVKDELADNLRVRFDDVLRILPNALLIYYVDSGIDKRSGGEFERHAWDIYLNNDDGLFYYMERFEPEHKDQALARFEELTSSDTTETAKRIVRPNRAAEAMARYQHLVTAQDWQGVRHCYRDDLVVIDHPTGATYGADQTTKTLQMLFRSDDAYFRTQPIATLGDSLCLCRREWGASATSSGRYDVGPSEGVAYRLTEIDEQGLWKHGEVFAENKLGDAITRLYERYTESLPEGSERKTASAISTFIKLGLVWDLKEVVALLAPDIQYVDHRHAGVGELNSPDALINIGRVLKEELTNNLQVKIEDVLRILPNAFLWYYIDSGTDKRSGGDFERHVWDVIVFNDAGLVSHWDRFEHEHKDQALARFEELTGSAKPEPVKRIVQPNLATAGAEKSIKEITAQNWDVVRSWLHDDLVEIDHTTGAKLGPDELMSSVRLLFKGEDPVYQIEPLATLGPHLMLGLRSISSSGAKGKRFDVGEYKHSALHLVEVDDESRLCRAEVFAENKLGEAVARLYERYAESLPEGPKRERAMATAHTVSLTLTHSTPQPGEEGYIPHVTGLENSVVEQEAFVPDVQGIDHRPVVGGIQHGNWFQQMQKVMTELVSDVSFQLNDIFALNSEALLRHTTYRGHLKEGGGEFELDMYLLSVFGPDGRQTQIEAFQAGQEEKALARFEELTGGFQVTSTAKADIASLPPSAGEGVVSSPKRRVTENSTTHIVRQVFEAGKAQDWGKIRTLLGNGYREHHHPTGSVFGVEEHIASIQRLYKSQDPYYEYEFVTSLGDSLALTWMEAGASGAQGRRYDVGAYEQRFYVLQGWDPSGVYKEGEIFAENKLTDAVIRLCERYAESLPDGSEKKQITAATEIVRSLPNMDVDRLTSQLAPDVHFMDHRTVGTGKLEGRDTVKSAIKVMTEELTENLSARLDDVYCIQPNAILGLYGDSGIDKRSGGEFERNIWDLLIIGEEGLVTRWERFDFEHLDDAIARFDELTQEKPVTTQQRRIKLNLVTQFMERWIEETGANNWTAVRALAADDYQEIDHPNGTTFSPDELVSSIERLYRSDEPYAHYEVLATLGPYLYLGWRQYGASGAQGRRYQVGPYEHKVLQVLEADENGLGKRGEIFAENKLGEALVHLYERYAEQLPEGRERQKWLRLAEGTSYANGKLDVDRMAANFAPDLQMVDHRVVGVGTLQGAEAVSNALNMIVTELAENVAGHIDDVRGVHPNAQLFLLTTTGTDRRSGGEFERQIWELMVVDDDGMLVHWERFEPEHLDRALARFDELTADTQPAPTQPHVQENAASAMVERSNELFKEGDWDTVYAYSSDDYVEIHHPTGSTYGREETASTMKRLMRAQDPFYENTLLATLGPRLCLCRGQYGAAADKTQRYDVGPFENVFFSVFEINQQGKICRVEIFAENKLGDALFRIYELFAESLPEGPERDRAGEVAASINAMLTPFEMDIVEPRLAADMAFTDNRLLGSWNGSGKDEVAKHTQGLHEVADNIQVYDEEVLATEPNLLLIRRMHAGIERVGGGDYERPFLILMGFDHQGLNNRWEFFDVGDEAKALARFDELTADTRPTAIQQSASSNAPTDGLARVLTALKTKDWAGLRATYSDDYVETHHPTGSTFGPEQSVKSIKANLESESGYHEITQLATLGTRLFLNHMRAGASGKTSKRYDIGPYEHRFVSVVQANEQGLNKRHEVFAEEKLGDALVRIYELYAESLPEGTERDCASRIATTMTMFNGPVDIEHMPKTAAPSYKCVDHRIYGTWTSDSVEKHLLQFSAQLELVSDFACRLDEVIELRPQATCLRFTYYGTDRTSGGLFENCFCGIQVWDANGQISITEVFEREDIDKARARFKELTSESPHETGAESEQDKITAFFTNQATLKGQAFMSCFLARDWEGAARLLRPDFRYDDRRRLVQVELDKSQFIDFARHIGDMESTQASAQLLATRGERLTMVRTDFEGSDGDIGPSSVSAINVGELDEDGAMLAWVRFDLQDIDAAYAELDARFNAGEGAHITSKPSDYVQAINNRDWDAVAAFPSADFVEYDYRPLAVLGTRHGGEKWAEAERALIKLAPDTQLRLNHVRCNAHCSLNHVTFYGTQEGGAYEIQFLTVSSLNASGRLCRNDLYEPEQLDDALARFEEISAGTDNVIRADTSQEKIAAYFNNAAAKAGQTYVDLFMQRDWDGIKDLMSPNFRCQDRQPHVQLDLSRDEFISFARQLGDMASIHLNHEILATRGNRLYLNRMIFIGEDGDVGTSETETLNIAELDENGQVVTMIRFSPDDLDAAYAELDTRYEKSEGIDPQLSNSAYKRAYAERDWDAISAMTAPGFTDEDRSTLSLFGTLAGGDDWVSAERALVELAPDAQVRFDHIRRRGRYTLSHVTFYGTRDGGPFEMAYLNITEVNADGRFIRNEFYEPRQIDEAAARFKEISAGASNVISADASQEKVAAYFTNAATKAGHAYIELFLARDWDAAKNSFSPDFLCLDRQHLVKLELNRDDFITFARQLGDMQSTQVDHQILASRGDRLYLNRWIFVGSDGDIGTSETETLNIFELDENGEVVTMIRFSPDDLDAAYTELDARFYAGEAAGHPTFLHDYRKAFKARDWDAIANLVAPDFVEHDNRRLAILGSTEGGENWANMEQALVELAPDTQVFFEHHRQTDNSVFGLMRFAGTRDGGDYELPFLCLASLDSEKRMQRLDLYDPEQFDEAVTRFNELSSRIEPKGEGLAPEDKIRAYFTNDATKAFEAATTAYRIKDWTAFAEYIADDAVLSDKRPILRIDLEGKEKVLEYFRPTGDLANTTVTQTMIATRGERLAIRSLVYEGSDGDIGPSEFSALDVIEVNEDGQVTSFIRYTPEDSDAAYAELDARFNTGEGAHITSKPSDYVQAVNNRDWDAVAAFPSADFVEHDNRPLAVLGTRQGGEKWAETERALVELAPDTQLRLNHIRHSAHGAFSHATFYGTQEGGDYEIQFLIVGSLNSSGILSRNDLYEPEQLDEAAARFEELSKSNPDS